MERVKGTAGVKPLECINPGRNRWAVRLDVQKDAEGAEDAVSYVEEVYDHEPTADDVRSLVLMAIEAYDTSDAVNGFVLDGRKMWLDNLNRTSLLEVARSAAASDPSSTVEVWADGEYMNVPAPDLVGYLSQLIVYAKATFDVTQHHKMDVHAITEVEGLLEYNVRADYPPTLVFELSD